MIEYIVKVHEEDGSYWAEVLDLPGCFASGQTLDELREALGEAIGLYLADQPTDDDKDRSARDIAASTGSLSVGEMRVRVAA
ncbi:MAG: type II toxin-antitoxin system HicB family antitoxin [Thermoleophilia bacterium]|nr:type II toxin-antitoxin system HicB family antitoxin [Thermoleophilia bacterium]